MTIKRAPFVACISGLLAMSALACGGGSGGSDDSASGGSGTSGACSLTDTGDAQSGVKTGTFPCTTTYYYDGADTGIFTMDHGTGTSRSSVYLLFHGKPTDVTETSPNLDLTSPDPNPADTLPNNPTGMFCGNYSWGTTNAVHAVIGDNKFTLKFVGEPEPTSRGHYTSHGTFHADCAPNGRQVTGKVTMDVKF